MDRGQPPPALAPAPALARIQPRLGFLGLGWIGRNRMQAIAEAAAARICAIAEPCEELRREAARLIPNAAVGESFTDFDGMDLDGVVIATPSALHAEQTMAALQRGWAVFCQKPLGRNAAEVRSLIDTARRVDRLLAIDLSYRFVTEVRCVHELIASGALGDVYAADLVFHNAYGPDKPWYYDVKLSGGGCVMDLGIHLVDLALWCLGFPQVEKVSSRLFAAGQRLRARMDKVEDYATARLELANGAVVNITCSWRAAVGCDAIISGTFFGTRAGAAFRNLKGSFYHFTAERYQGTKSETLACTTEPWGGRAAVEWAERLGKTRLFDREAEKYIASADVLDSIYANS
jgi:predicted dehydrogenase